MLRTGRKSGSEISQRRTRPSTTARATTTASPSFRAGASNVDGGVWRSIFQGVMGHARALHRSVGSSWRELRHGQSASSWRNIGARMERSIRIDGVVVLRGYPSEPDCLPHERRNALGLHLFHDLSAIALDRAHADMQPGGNSVTREPFHHEIENLDLSGCEPREPI